MVKGPTKNLRIIHKPGQVKSLIKATNIRMEIDERLMNPSQTMDRDLRRRLITAQRYRTKRAEEEAEKSLRKRILVKDMRKMNETISASTLWSQIPCAEAEKLGLIRWVHFPANEMLLNSPCSITLAMNLIHIAHRVAALHFGTGAAMQLAFQFNELRREKVKEDLVVKKNKSRDKNLHPRWNRVISIYTSRNTLSHGTEKKQIKWVNAMTTTENPSGPLFDFCEKETTEKENRSYLRKSIKYNQQYAFSKRPIEFLGVLLSSDAQLYQAVEDVLTFLNVRPSTKPVEKISGLQKGEQTELQRLYAIEQNHNDQTRLRSLVQQTSCFAGVGQPSVQRVPLRTALVHGPWGESPYEKEIVEFLLGLSLTTAASSALVQNEELSEAFE
jgi:hypothetical protein